MIPEQPLQATIKFLTGPLTNKVFTITQTVITIGRDRSNDIIISDQHVSRFHARLTFTNNRWEIEKLSETNTVTVNHQEQEQVVLSHNMIIGLGDSNSFIFSLAPIESKQPEDATQRVKPSPNLISDTHVQTDSVYRANTAAKQERAPGTEIASLSELGISSLEITDNTTGSKKTYPLVKETINIGRERSNDIVIDVTSVSALHCQIVREENRWVLIHPHPLREQTLNGLLYQGRKIAGNTAFRKTLTNGNVFRIGDELGVLVTLTYNDNSGIAQEMNSHLQPIRLGAAEIKIGRLPDNDVVLSHPQVSARHAYLVREQDTYRLIDLHSTNHTYVNGLNTTSQLLKPRDEIRIGPFKFIYTETGLTQFDESEGIRIEALHLKKVGTNQTVLLNDISLHIPTRSFVALVGGSGAGKTTLLDALSGLRPAQEGSVFYNGQDYYHNAAAFSTQLGYVPQDDIIHRELTVERALYYAARLRLPSDFEEEMIEQRIDEVLDDVEMKHRRKLLINQLSGGQRKRVSIALELLAKPSVFFLDEPTSGLDPGLDRKMMILLRKLADKGHTVILVTHATNNINVCDYVCFLAQGGNLAYFGPPEGTKTYFKTPDFAEIYSTLEPNDEQRTIPSEAREKFSQSEQYQQYIGDYLDPEIMQRPVREQSGQAKVSRRGRRGRQFSLLSMRYIELLRNDMGNLAILLLQAPLIGLLLLLFIKGIGVDGFAPINLAQCPVTATILAPHGYPDVSTPDDPIVTNDCQKVVNFLKNTPQGQAYARARGGNAQALQDFIRSGPGDAPVLLFLMGFSAIMFGCINSIREFVKEAPIYKRERTVNLGILPYMLSKIVVLAVLCLVQSLILVVCVEILDPFGHSVFLPPFLEVYITIALTSLAGLMLGLTISAIAPNNDRAMSFLPLILLPQVIFSGSIFPLTSWFLQYPAMLFPIRWAMIALGSTAGLHSDKINGDKFVGDIYSYHSTLYSIYSQADSLRYLLLGWLALAVMIIALGGIIGYCLKRKDVRR
ncbi:MAG: FHA domain-containing protein [Ktedonobacteraceae bacterium]|nr:FHA domain-containing protein [Ktedonobacteraceae bacterium]